MLADGRVAARQRRAASAAGRTRSRGGGRGSLPAGARLGAPARCPLLGTARRREPRPLLRDQGRSADAVALLQPVYDRFTEGFETADLKAAKALLNALQELGVGVARAAPCADRA